MRLKIIKHAAIYLAGTILEWYDFALIGVMSSVIAKEFFPLKNSILSLLAVFGAFAGGFIMRPLGAFLFGYLGDKVGRKYSLMLAILCMTVFTTAIGLLPTYSVIGIFAPILLVLFRMMQGLSAGGEYPGATVALYETAVKRKGVITSLGLCGTVIGMLLGTLVGTLVINLTSERILFSWGWRVPFLVSIFLGVICFYLRYRMDEPDRKPMVKGKVIKIYQHIMKKHGINLLLFSGCILINIAAFYLVFVYFPNYFISIKNMDANSIFILNAATMLVVCILIPIFGHISDKVDPLKLMLAGGISLVVLSNPLFMVLEQSNLFTVFIIENIFMFFAVMFITPAIVYAPKLFPKQVRFTSVALGLSVPTAFFGGTTPMIATYLVHVTGNEKSPCIYLIVVALFGVISTILLKKRMNRKLF